ncbi:MAG: endonuclease III domain-containing protein [Thermodesulfobacteriota bacterium]
MTKKARIERFYEELYDKFGPQGWWPAKTALECILGAILTQNTSWSNVEKALDNLMSQNLISIERLDLITTDELAVLIRPSGYYNQKAVKIKKFVSFLLREYSGSLDNMFAEDKSILREKLLSIQGIGPETADSIMLYAGMIPVFVVDAYTWRILSRHGLVPIETSYDEIQELFTDSLREDAVMFNEYHALLVKVGKEHCRKRNPLCGGCPLEFDPHEV